MPTDLPRFRDGDALEPYVINAIVDELARWRKLTVAPPLAAEGIDGDGPPTLADLSAQPLYIRLTSVYQTSSPYGYDWEEVQFGPGRAVETTGQAGTVAGGDPAYETQTGDTSLTADGTIYLARRSPASGEILFDGKN